MKKNILLIAAYAAILIISSQLMASNFSLTYSTKELNSEDRIQIEKMKLELSKQLQTRQNAEAFLKTSPSEEELILKLEKLNMLLNGSESIQNFNQISNAVGPDPY